MLVMAGACHTGPAGVKPLSFKPLLRTDLLSRKSIETYITLETLNQAYLYNPRNVYQNYDVATNSSDRTIYTYMGKLLPRFGNATYSSAGQLNPLLNDPYYRTIGLGTRIFIGGAAGYVAWHGTQHNPQQERLANGTTLGPGGTLAVIGDLKQMNPAILGSPFLRATGYLCLWYSGYPYRYW